eukprot:5452603-Alexandrium_andersonii.AAC.1
MSASLVGSEMCIRDRWRPKGRGPRSGVAGGIRRHVDTRRAPLDLGNRLSCLLYTSDAADDM